MTYEPQDTMQEAERDIQNVPSRLEKLAFSALGATGGILLTGAFLYDPLSAAGVSGVAVGVTAGAVTMYLEDKTRYFRKRLGAYASASALIASLATGAGYAIGNHGNRISSVTPITIGEEQGIVVKTLRDNQTYLLRDGTNYVSLKEARESALRSATSSYAEKEREIRSQYEALSRTARPTNKLESPKK